MYGIIYLEVAKMEGFSQMLLLFNTENFFVCRQGILKAGDRILKVNGVDVSHASQMETHSLLKTGEGICTLEVEYDVTLHGMLINMSIYSMF